MEKGTLGIRLGFYGIIAFVLAFLSQTTLLFLLAGVVILAEKNEWASRQVIQALCLCLAGSVLKGIFGIVNVTGDFPFIGYYFFNAWSILVSGIRGLIDIVILVFVIIGIIKNAKGEEANIPLASQFADWAYGVIKTKI